MRVQCSIYCVSSVGTGVVCDTSGKVLLSDEVSDLEIDSPSTCIANQV